MANDLDDTIASEVISASLSGAISASILYPLEVLKTKMQARSSTSDDDDEDERDRDATMVQYATALYRREGAGVFFRGVEMSAFQSATEKALYFFAYTALKELHLALTDGGKLDTLTNLALGCAAEWAHLPITLPLDCWTTQIQTTKGGETPMALLCALLSAGPSKMYQGIHAYTVLCLKPALQYTIFERVKAAVVASRVDKSLAASEAFLLGMVARTISTVVVFPYLRAKVMMQAAKSDNTNNDEKSISILSLLGTMHQQGGVSAWFQGLGPELTRGVLSAALMLMIKEKIGTIVKQMLLGNHHHQQQQPRKKLKY